MKILCYASVWSMTEKLLKLLINLDLVLVSRFCNFVLTECVVLAMHPYYAVAECLMSFYKEQISHLIFNINSCGVWWLDLCCVFLRLIFFFKLINMEQSFLYCIYKKHPQNQPNKKFSTVWNGIKMSKLYLSKLLGFTVNILHSLSYVVDQGGNSGLSAWLYLSLWIMRNTAKAL